MGRDLFEQFVAEAVETIPEFFQQEMENVEVVVEDCPDPETMQRAGVKNRAQLLGFYHGIPKTKRTHNYGLVLPDKISIYRQPIMMRCHDWEEVLRMVHRVVRHEVAHHFGIDDDRLREIGAY